MENNFKKLHQERISSFEKNKSGRIESNIQGNISFFKLIGNFFELFLPNQVKTLSKFFESDNTTLRPIDDQKKPDRFPQ
ncbi:MAG: hypothetical protein HOP11_08790 [Saprospiraceae bacterium]|nr:hypothetical protein [Saprospiraceae bacterium]